MKKSLFGLIVLFILLTTYTPKFNFIENSNLNIQKIEIETHFTLFLSLLNSPAMIFDMAPFIVLITSQIFFVKLFNNNELATFKYTGLKNSEIIKILMLLSFITGIFTTTIFYYFSSNFKNLYLELKSPFSNDGKYLAVVTQNGLWIRDKIDNTILIVNSSKIDENFLIDNFITEFDENYNVKRNIISK